MACNVERMACVFTEKEENRKGITQLNREIISKQLDLNESKGAEEMMVFQSGTQTRNVRRGARPHELQRNANPDHEEALPHTC